jgi:AraC-like DNA-binding protein
MEPLEFDSANVDQVEAFLSEIYSKMRIGAVGPRTRARIARRVLAPGVGFDDLDYSFDIGYSAEPQGLLIICDVLTNTIRRIGEGWDETFGPGDQFLISRPGLPYGGVAHATRLRFTVLDPALLTKVASTGDAGGTGPVRVLDHRPVSRAAAGRLQRATAYLRDSVLANPGADHAPLVLSTASQYLAATVLHTFPNTALTEPTGEDRHDAHDATLRRAVAFIDSHADTDLTVADIAAAAHVTVRALQYAFRRHLDSTPMAYLRRVRLDAAHQTLHAADPSAGDTVTTIAARWGFAHPGRFATQYRRLYGQAPSRTLHQ